MMKLVVLSCVLAVAMASAPFYVAPLAPFVAPIKYAAPLFQPYNYRGPLSLAPGQPANILGADGRPLDTLEVNRDRSAHFTAKTGLHLLKKRSAAFITAPVAHLAVVASRIGYVAHIAAEHIGSSVGTPFIRPITYTPSPLIHTF